MFTKKFMTILGAILAAFSLMGGIWAFDGRYAVKAEVNHLEVQVVDTLKQYRIEQQNAQEIFQNKTDYKFYQFIYNKNQQDLFNVKRELRNNPNDLDLQRDYNELLRQKDEVKKTMDELLRNIK